jgi:hypothetical protein
MPWSEAKHAAYAGLRFSDQKTEALEIDLFESEVRLQSREIVIEDKCASVSRIVYPPSSHVAGT